MKELRRAGFSVKFTNVKDDIGKVMTLAMQFCFYLGRTTDPALIPDDITINQILSPPVSGLVPFSEEVRESWSLRLLYNVLVQVRVAPSLLVLTQRVMEEVCLIFRPRLLPKIESFFFLQKMTPSKEARKVSGMLLT